MRSSILRHTADIFDPDLLIVDKEPLGLRGEVRDTLDLLQRRGTALILGLRDVMDDPEALESEWERKHAVPALAEYYDEIWVYGLPQICDPLAGLSVPTSVRRRMTYTGYLRRSAAEPQVSPEIQGIIESEFLLVTPGGGGDGEALIDLVLSAYEYSGGLPLAALLVFGPFMLPEQRAIFASRAARLENVHAITFNARLEALMARATGVVAMGGYNTFCEILSFDKRALIVPRTAPRLEQYIRTRRAAELGILTMLSEQEARDPRVMAAALRHLTEQAPPSSVMIPGLLDGMPSVNRLVRKWLDEGRAGCFAARERLEA
jgi:predicted glycosyltransferase